MKRLFVTAAIAALCAGSANAAADLQTYSISGGFQGYYVVDRSTKTLTDFSLDIDTYLFTTSTASMVPCSVCFDKKQYIIGGYVGGPETVHVNNTQISAWNDFSLVIPSLYFSHLDTSITYSGRASSSGYNYYYSRGVSVDAVPEPATWAMFIGGFGLIGGAMRSRKKVSARFA